MHAARAGRRGGLVALLLGASLACSSSAAPTAPRPRTYRLGFSDTPPQLTTQSVLQTIDAWRPHADVALVSQSVPWAALLADTSAALLVHRDLAPVVAIYRGRGLPLIVELDATDGLSRDREAPQLVALGRSIADTAVQTVYRQYLLAVDSILHPEYLGLAMETNLVRAIAPATVYSALRTMTAAGAADLVARGSTARRFVSVQAETAWGRLPNVGQYVGVDADRADFPFIQALGLSSYPYLGGFATPEDVPLDYYARVGGALPMLVVEGGWSSASGGGVTSSPDIQARWIKREIAIADSAKLVALTQITFTDLDLASYGAPPDGSLDPFAHLGLVDTSFHPKPALAEWDRAIARPLVSP